MKQKYLILVVVGMFLAGCKPVTTPSQTTAESTSTILYQNLATASPIPSKTPVSFTDTPRSVSNDCFALLGEVPNKPIGRGIAVLESRKYDDIGRGVPGFYLLDMEKNELSNLDNSSERYGYAFVSPNGLLMSVEKITLGNDGTTQSDQLLILGADGSIQKALPWEKDAVSGAFWLDNENVVMNIDGTYQPDKQGNKPDTLLVLNPFTGKRQTLKPNYPNLYDGYPLPFWSEPWQHSLSVYNPSLSHVVYLSEGGFTYILWDVNKKKEIERLLHWNIASDERPRWSPNGSMFVMSAYLGDTSSWPQPADGLYLVDIEGNITKLLSTNSDLHILDHFWSPSGRYLALLESVNNPEIQQKKLLILDTRTLKIVDTCVEYRSLIQNDMPIWSPDETQILLYESTKEHSDVILVDLAKRIAFPIAEEMEPKGWMKSP